jgi:hypothetical protein
MSNGQSHIKEVTIRIGPPHGAPPVYELKLLADGNERSGTLSGDDISRMGADFIGGKFGDDHYKQDGLELHDRIDQASGAEWSKLRQAGPCRTYLEIQAGDLSGAPWEILCAPGSPWLMLDPQRPIVRRRVAHVDPCGKGVPVRVLFVIGSAPIDERVLAEKEVRLVKRAVREVDGLLDLQVIERPARRDLLSEIGTFRPHILHFVGHGGNTTKVRGGAAPPASIARLRFEYQAGGWDWSIDDIAVDLPVDGTGPAAGRWMPRLAILNACRTSSPAAPDPMQRLEEASSIADTFLARGAAAVVGMHGDIKGEAAGLFSAALYTSLGRGQPLDAAVAQARKEMNQNNYSYREACMVSLTVAIAPEQVLPPFPNAQSERVDGIKRCEKLKQVLTFVNHDVPRRRVLHHFSPPNALDGFHPLVVVRGAPTVGKSAVAFWMLAGAVRLGHLVRYVEIADATAKNWLDILRLIRGVMPHNPKASPILEALPPDNFHRFNWNLNHRLRNEDPKPWDHNPVTDEGAPMAGTLPEKFIERTFDDFRLALAAQAKETPLTIALDHFRRAGVGLDKSDYRHLRKHLFNPVAGVVPGVHLLLVLSDDDYAALEMDTNDDSGAYETPFEEITVPMLQKKEFLELAGEFVEGKYVEPLSHSGGNVRLNAATVRQNLQLFLNGYTALHEIPDPWPIKELATLDSIIRMSRGKAAGG